MKQIIKIISIMIICSYFLTTANSSKAWINPNENVILDVVENYQEIYYQNKLLKIPMAVCYRESGKVQPIYNLKHEKEYLTGNLAYYTKIDKIIDNDKARRILLLGYPNVSFQQLGCMNEDEAYIITQIALLDVYYQYNLDDFTVTSKNPYPNILKNLRNLIQKANNATEVYKKPELTLDDESIEWQKEENKNSKIYKVISNLDFENYTVSIQGENIGNIKIVNEQNEIKSTFAYGEKFKITVPDQENINFIIQVTAEFGTMPIREGNALTEEWESYIILDNSEIVIDTLKQNHSGITGNTEEKPETDNPLKPEESEKVTQTQIITDKKLPVTGY